MLGAGGMGEVYSARDPRLGRDVAIKILPEHFVADRDRIARFQREAQVLASLNHPNIAIIHDLQQTGGFHALVLELVDGPTLADRLAQGPMPFDEAFGVARQIAEALEAAHEQGIVHRDLKPANVKLRPDGTVKVLDFGLAKTADGAASAVLSMSPTLSSPATQAGVILGTAAYMSPEQARGKPIDKRSDVWSFGCVLFEMLTAARTFEGEDVTDVLASVIRAEPDWSKLPANTPPAIQKLLRRCLVKDRKERLPDIGTARLDLKDALAIAEEAGVTSETIARTQRSRSSIIAWAVAATAVLAAIGTLSIPGQYRKTPASSAPRYCRIPARLGPVSRPPHDFRFRPMAASSRSSALRMGKGRCGSVRWTVSSPTPSQERTMPM